MKKLALSPLVALAITGLAASPVIASPSGAAFDSIVVSNAKAQAPAPESTSESTSEPSDRPSDQPPEAAETQDLDVTVAVAPGSISQSDLADRAKGVTVTVSGLQPGDTVTDTLTNDTTTAQGTVVEFTIYSTVDDPSTIATGTVPFEVTVTRGEESTTLEASFEVTADEETPTAPAVDPKATLEATTITVSEFAGDGLKFTGEGFTPGGTVSVEGAAVPPEGAQGTQSRTAAPQAEEQLRADENGNVVGTVVAAEGSVEPGRYTVTFVDDESGEKTEPAEFTVTADATTAPTTPAAEASLTVTPKSITPADFVNTDRGVDLAVENCEPGADVRYLVTPKGDSNVTAYDNTVTADDEGKSSVKVYGTSASNPSAYIGDYTVTVTCGDEELTGTFAVEEAPNAGGGTGSGDAGSSGSLPRTGIELTGLAAGTALLLVGGAVVTMTNRRRKAPASPTDI